MEKFVVERKLSKRKKKRERDIEGSEESGKEGVKIKN